MKFNFRNILAFSVANFYKMVGLVGLHKQHLLQNDCIVSIYFHNPSRNLFKSCITWLQSNGFSFIAVDDVIAIARGEKSFAKGSVVITVDDGWKSNKKNIAEVAHAMGIPVTIFISTDPVEHGEAYWWSYVNMANKRGLFNEDPEFLKKMNNSARRTIINEIKSKILLEREAMSVDDINEINLSKWISIGSHTVTHPILTQCTDEELLFELSASKLRIEDMICEEVHSFAYPNGNFSDREIRQLQKLGYDIAFCTKPAIINHTNIHNLFSLPRFEVLEEASFAENVCRMSGVWFLKNKLFKS